MKPSKFLHLPRLLPYASSFSFNTETREMQSEHQKKKHSAKRE